MKEEWRKRGIRRLLVIYDRVNGYLDANSFLCDFFHINDFANIEDCGEILYIKTGIPEWKFASAQSARRSYCALSGGDA